MAAHASSAKTVLLSNGMVGQNGFLPINRNIDQSVIAKIRHAKPPQAPIVVETED
jgi:hypothetical protein